MQVRSASIVLSLVSCGVVFGTSPAWATCGSANCFLVTGTQEGVRPSGILTVDLTYRYISQTRKLEGSEVVSDVLVPTIDFDNGVIDTSDLHREIRTQNTFVQVDLSYGVTPRLTIAGYLPIINKRDHEHDHEAGTPTEHFSNQDGTSGFGDVHVGARYAFVVKTKDLLVGGLTIKVPTGAYTLRDSEGEINEPTIQPGTGATDVILSLYYAHQVAPGRFEWFGSASWRDAGENDLDYEFGDETLASAGIRHKPGARMTWSLQANLRRTGRDHFASQEVPSTGATLIDLTPGLQFEAGTGTSLYGFFQYPVSQDVNDLQLAPRGAFLAGVSKSF